MKPSALSSELPAPSAPAAGSASPWPHLPSLLFFVPAFAALLLPACTAFHRPVSQADPDLAPELWDGATAATDGAIATGWLSTFRDPHLDSLVDEAMAHNPGLGAAADRLASAEEGRIGARARRLPGLGFGASTSRGQSGDGSGDFEGSESYRLSLNASWEIDLWGRLRDLDRAAAADLVASRADYRGARLSLAANAAKAWFNLIAALQQEQIAEANRDSFVRNHRITERNYKAGDQTASPLSVQLGRSNVASAERSLVRSRLNREEAARSLELLLGRYPAAELEGVGELPALSSGVPAGLPSELLIRRPDLVAAAADLEASARRADAARKDLLPSLSLSGGVSNSDGALRSALLQPDYFLWSTAASLAQTVYDGGAPSAAARGALANNSAAVHTFADRALRAFREVESALATERSLAEQQVFLETELAQSTFAEAQAARDYSEGLVNIISLLEAQRRAVNARTSMISIRNQRLQNRIDLHLALGGDFETTE